MTPWLRNLFLRSSWTAHLTDSQDYREVHAGERIESPGGLASEVDRLLSAPYQSLAAACERKAITLVAEGGDLELAGEWRRKARRLRQMDVVE